MNDVFEKLLSIFKNIFDDENIIINSSTTAGDIDGWDSLAHIRLMIAIEKSFDIRFLASEINQLDNVGQIVNIIIKKTS